MREPSIKKPSRVAVNAFLDTNGVGATRRLSQVDLTIKPRRGRPKKKVLAPQLSVQAVVTSNHAQATTIKPKGYSLIQSISISFGMLVTVICLMSGGLSMVRAQSHQAGVSGLVRIAPVNQGNIMINYENKLRKTVKTTVASMRAPAKLAVADDQKYEIIDYATPVKKVAVSGANKVKPVATKKPAALPSKTAMATKKATAQGYYKGLQPAAPQSLHKPLVAVGALALSSN